MLGVIAGLLIIGGVIWFSVRFEGRPSRGKAWLAKRSGREDTGREDTGPERGDLE